MKKLENFINKKNNLIKLFTPGPASLLKENILGIAPCFGRGDRNYLKTEKRVLSKLKKLSGQKNIVCMQGSGSAALESVALDFFKGRILIVKTGYYSDRLLFLSKLAKKTHKFIKKIDYVDWKKINNYKKKADWIWACYTETSIGFKLPIHELQNLAKKTRAKLALDATASIGLENNHKFAEVVSFSSCKGLFGLTGASFVSYNSGPKNYVNSFVLNLKNIKNKKMTGPYHIIQSLDHVLKNYNNLKKSVIINKRIIEKKYNKFLIYKKKNQPLLCTYLNKIIKKNNSKVILYKPRIKINGSVISHLGEAHLGKNAKGEILNYIK